MHASTHACVMKIFAELHLFNFPRTMNVQLQPAHHRIRPSQAQSTLPAVVTSPSFCHRHKMSTAGARSRVNHVWKSLISMMDAEKGLAPSQCQQMITTIQQHQLLRNVPTDSNTSAPATQWLGAAVRLLSCVSVRDPQAQQEV